VVLGGLASFLLNLWIYIRGGGVSEFRKTSTVLKTAVNGRIYAKWKEFAERDLSENIRVIGGCGPHEEAGSIGVCFPYLCPSIYGSAPWTL
jgi:hypothetical protein